MSEKDLESRFDPEDPERPECFGDGERVCPEDEYGIMQPQANCLPCAHLRPCMQTVLHYRGKIRLVERPVSSRVTGFFKRWSNQKLACSEKKAPS